MKALNELLKRKRDSLSRSLPTPGEPWESRDARERLRGFIGFLERFSVNPNSLEIEATVTNLGEPDRGFKFIIKDLGVFGFGVHAYETTTTNRELVAGEWLTRGSQSVSESWVGSFTGARWARAEDHGLQCFGGEAGLESAIKAVRMAPSVIPGLTGCQTWL